MQLPVILLCYLVTLAWTNTVTSGLQIGVFTNTQHQVSGTVHVDDDTTVRFENFHYDGLGPDAYVYYYAKGIDPYTGTIFRTPAHTGIVIPVPSSAGGGPGGRFGGRRFNDERLVLTMPSGSTVHDIGHLTIWCQLADSFFNAPMEFPSSIVFNNPGGGGDNQKPRNCVPLNDQLQLSWMVNTTIQQPMATFTLCGCLRTDGYMAFGLSGSADSVTMDGGDVTVAWMDTKAHAEDYFLERREQCRSGIGVCPDRGSHVSGTCIEDNFDITGSVSNGVTCVTYSRLLNTSDTSCDRIFDISRLERTYIIWALGPRGDTAFQHFTRSAASSMPLNLTRDILNECTTAPRCTSCTGFTPSSIRADNGTTFVAEIGASGGEPGYQSITGQAGWGIAWYINGQLVPELNVTRGKTYTFRVFGGNNDSIRASYHPFYITDSRSGGRLLNTLEQRRDERVFAGFDDKDRPTGVGTLCEYGEGSGSEAIRQQCGTVQQYLGSLVKGCRQNPAVPGEVVFRPDDNTPDVVYYQCATHKNLGWRINVSAGSVLVQSWMVMFFMFVAVSALVLY